MIGLETKGVRVESGEREKKSVKGDKNVEGEQRKVGGRNGYEEEKNKVGGRNEVNGDKRKYVGYANVVRGEETGGEKGVRRIESGKQALEAMNVGKMFLPKYTSTKQDVLWARRGLVATVLNGEAIPELQRRIFDAGFEKLDSIPLGADKVLL